MKTQRKTQTAGFSLKSFKHAKFASQETECFEALLVYNDVVVAHARNEGHGGCNEINLTEAGRNNPFIVAANGIQEYEDNSLDSIINELVYAKLQEKADARLIKKIRKSLDTQILFVRKGDKPGGYRCIRHKFTDASLCLAEAKKFAAANPDATVFNLLPFDEAYNMMVVTR